MTVTRTAPLESPVSTPEVVRVERLLAHPPRRVWRALTEKDAIEKWLLPVSPSKASDHDTCLHKPGDSVTLRAAPAVHIGYEVAEVEPEQSLSLWWRVQSQDTEETVTTRVTWTLTPEQEGTATRLVIEHKPYGITALAAARASAPLNGVMARFAVYLELGRTYRRDAGRGVTRKLKEKIRCQ